ncbi:MAG: hypothetical protein N2749_00660, partial [Clostridia bacterium]|nr:hypothetical protein [Clostridia bacterium]
MEKKYNIKTKLFIVMIFTMIFSIMALGQFVSASEVYTSLSAPSTSVVNSGGSVTFTITYTGAYSIMIGPGSIVTNGFTATKTVTGTGNTRTITLSNVQGISGSKTISITGGTAISDTGALSYAVTSTAFTLQEAAPQDTTRPVLSISGPSSSTVKVGGTITYTLNYSDNVGIASIMTGPGAIVT